MTQNINEIDRKKLFSSYKKFLRKNLKKYRLKILGGLLLGLVYSFISLIVPLISKVLIDDVILKHDEILLKKVILGLFVLFIANTIINIAYNFILIIYGDKVLFNIKLDFYKHIFGLPYSFFHEKKVGEINYRLFDDVNILHNSVIGIPVTVIINLFMILLAGTALFILQWKLSLIITILFIIQGALAYLFLKPIRRKAKIWKQKEESIRGVSIEHLNSIYLIKASSLETVKRIDFFNSLRKLFKIRIDFGKQTKIYEAFVTSSSSLILYTILGYGAYEIFKFNMTIGGLVAFLNFAAILYKPASMLFRIIIDSQSIIVSLSRFFEIQELEREAQIRNNNGKKQYASRIEGAVELNNITFSYDQRDTLLDNFNLQIKPGEKIAIVGKTGIGKSTICNLILGLYHDYTGDIKIDNIDLNDWDIARLRKQIGVVAQNNFVTDGNIMENINIFREDRSLSDIQEAAKSAHIDDYINSLKDNYYTEIGEKGIKISGGEAQRIAIARAFLQDPRIVVWDEPTSFLDRETEERILDSFERLTRNKTCIVVTHKPAFLSKVDRVIDLEKC